MTPAEKEALEVEKAYSRAYVQYGAVAALQVVQAWEGVDRLTPSGRLMLLSAVTAHVLAGRKKMAALAVRRTQLVNALRKGRQLKGGPDGAETLQDLREALTEALKDVGAARAKRAVGLDANMVIPVSAEAGSVAGLIEEINDGIDTDIENVVEALGNGRLGKIARKEGVVTPKDVRTSRDLVASGAERLVLNGGRQTDAQILQLNRDLLGFVRVHDYREDEPCGFCAMLMSRGPVYGSHRAAEGFYNEDAEEWNKYHFNCHCSAVSVYSQREWLTNPLLADNRMYQQEWNRVIKDRYSGDAALSEWRKHVKSLNASRDNATQVAA